MKRTKAKEGESEAPQPNGVAVVGSLRELNTMAQETFPVQVWVGNPRRQVSILVRRLTPAEEAKVNLIALRALPPVVVASDGQGKPASGKEAEPRFDLSNPEYQEKAQHNKLLARALALYCAVPMFREGAPESVRENGELNLTRLLDWVQEQATEEVLETLYRAVSGGGADFAEALNFFSPGGSPAN